MLLNSKTQVQQVTLFSSRAIHLLITQAKETVQLLHLEMPQILNLQGHLRMNE